MTQSHRESSKAVCERLTNAMRSSRLSRAEIADRISDLTGLPCTERRLNNYAADSRPDYRWPAELDVAFCIVLNDYSLLADRVERAGFRMIGPEEERLIAIGRAFLQKRAAERLLEEEAANG